MKTISLQFIQMIFAQSKRLLLLLLLLLFVVAYANSGSYKYAKVEVQIHPLSTGAGTVYVQGANGGIKNSTDDKETPVESIGRSDSQTSDATTVNFTLDAETNDNSYFDGWATSETSLTVETSDNPYSLSISSVSNTSSNPASVSKTYYGVFKKVISPNEPSISWIKNTDNETYSTQVELYKATNFRVESITHNGNPNTSTFDCNPKSTTTSDGTITLTISAGEDVKDGDKFVITLKSDNKGYATITVEIDTEIQVKFTRPTKGKGSYSAVRTNADGGKTCELDNNSSDYIATFNNMTHFYHTLTATPASGYRFYRWVIEDVNGITYYTTNPYGYKVKNGDCISVEFLPEGIAQFMVKDADGVYYYELDAAIAAAQKSTSKTVVVASNGSLNIDYKTPNADGQYEFIIPAGITLLVPGDAAHTVRNGDVTKDDVASDAGSTEYRKLTLLPNTSIIVNGNICVYSKFAKGQPVTAYPRQYGHIAMGDNCQITMKNGSKLAVYGYISGNPETSHIIAESGATVYEMFQIADWRGGTATISAYDDRNKYKVFPMTQYYVQNIETKLTLYSGATERVGCAMELSKVGVVVINIPLITKATTEEDQGFLCLGDNTKLTKWYDNTNDRQKYVVEGEANVTNAQAKISYIYLNVSYIELSSKDYVLPISNNIDISINNITLTSPFDVCFLAGSTLTIDKDAELQINKDVYIYDKEPVYYNGKSYTGFAHSGDVLVRPVGYTIAKKGFTRTAANTLDASFIVNGKLIVDGALYTTKFGENITDVTIQQQNYGANITSTGGGEVIFNKKGENTGTYQYSQTGSDLTAITIPVTNARLRNADKSWSAGANAEAGQRYIYYNDIDGGKWCLPTNAFTTSNIPTLAVTLPTATDTQFAEFKLRSTSMQESDFTVTLDNASFKAGELTIEGDKLKVPITYTAQNKQGSATANITLTYTPESFSLKEAITATEDYTPDFSVASTELAFDPIYVNGSGAEKALAITPGENNVTTLLDNENMVWTSPISGTNSSEFEFTYGEGKNKLSGAKVKFNPGSAGTNKSATLTLTATYTDANGAEKSKSVNVSLTATANLNPNNLAFAKFPDEIIAGVTSKFPLFEAGTNNAGITTELSEDGVIEIIKENGVYYVNVLSAGSVNIKATQAASPTIAGKEISANIMVKSKDAVLSRVPLCIDTKDKFNIHTVSANAVSYSNNNTIDFVSTETTSSEWEFQFLGIPDKLVFTPTGGNTWNVEERASAEEGWSPVVNWTTFTSGEQVAISLKPTTRQLRIQYGAGSGETGSISGLCVSAFTIKSDVDKVYLPVNGTSKEVKFIHTATPLTISEVDGVTATISSTENKGTNEEPYYETTVELTATEADKNVTLTASVTDANSSVHTKDIAIRTYAFPQELPIKLGEDALERYHFVTTASEYAQWDATNRKIVFQNPGAYLTRYVTFAFNGAPGEIRFTTSADINSSDWVIRESVDGVTFTEAAKKRTVEGTSFKQELHYTTRYLSVEYKSANLSEVALSGLVIEGFPMAWATPEQLSLSEEQKTVSFALTTVNLQNIKVVLNSTDFVMTHGSSAEEETEITLSSDDYAEALGINKVGDITFNVRWKSTGNVNQGLISVYNPDDNNKLLTMIKILGAKNIITKEDVSTGIYTGVADGYTSSFGSEYERHEVSLANAFAEDGTALFDYLIIYGETKTIDGTKKITAPTSSEGSNALTPYYVYSKAQSSETSGYDSYRFVQLVENANTTNKAEIVGFTTTADGTLPTVYVDVEGSLSVYMTGFCPYATTGKDKAQEGVWFFRGGNGENLDIYLEDCYLYSRNKTVTGVPMNKGIKDHSVFTEGYALGSGGVLVFENIDRVGNQNMEDVLPFKVNVHTIGKNVFKSNYGSFYEIFGMRAYQISAPLHIHMNSVKHVHDSKTELTLDDVWPTGLGENDFKRTNGFLSLQKQSNNAPSIDLGSPLSVVNFKGGQVELQNAQIVSPNYKTTLAISYRSGEYGGDDVGIKFAYGIGTDSVGGTVNFYDGTTTVLPMEVDAKYRQYYLMDTEPAIGEDGNPELDSEGNPVLKESAITSCLRCPRNTYVYGGSQCFMRACNHVTSKGGAPTDGYSQLGQYVYSYDESQGDSKDDNGLLTTMRFPGCVAGLTGENGYYTQKGYSPQWQSVTPDAENKVYFWIPDGFGGVEAEEDKLLTTWKACMTEIHAGYQTQNGSIGGNTPVEPSEEVKYLLYCQIDDNIHKIISEGKKDAEGNVIKDEDGNVLEYVYKAPVKVPDVAQGLAGGKYMTISPTYVGNTKANEVVSAENYTITDKVYYITTATADVWMTFTAPFDVEKIWVVETYSETELEKTAIKNDEKGNPLTKRESILLEQAKHNADFAAFFGVAMALGSTDDFETIFKQWRAWGLAEDKKVPEDGEALYNGTDADYALRDKYELTPYSKGDWETANFYLNHNTGDWGYSYDEELGDVFVPNWEIPTKAENTDGVLLEQGETYSMLFPYCVGCWEKDNRGNVLNREYWDYWSGKFLIFEGKQGKQTILGSNVFDDIFADENELTDKAILHGNNTFAFMTSETKDNVLLYSAAPTLEGFIPTTEQKMTILPAQSYLLLSSELNTDSESHIFSISRMGQIKYRPSSGDNNDDTQTGGEHVPTINGGSDLFVTSVAEGINIAVGEPQYVGVFSATGQLIYSGWVDTSVDVNLVVDGVYVVVGENTSLKVLY